MRSNTLFLSVFLLLPGLAAAQAATPVKVVKGVAKERPSPLKVSSNLLVEQDIAVSTRISGIVESIEADRGAEVKKGQPLAVLDQREFNLDRRSAEETLRVSKFEYERTQELFNQKLTSQAELEQKKAKHELAQVEYERAKLVIDRSVIRAPFDGVVVDRLVRIGQKVLVDDSSPLFKVTAFEPLLARAYLPESALRRVRVGEPVTISSAEFPDVRSQGQVSFVSPVIDAGSDTFQVLVKLPRDRDKVLRPGMAVQISFADAAVKRISLPSACLVDRGARSRGTVLEVDGGVVKARTIEFERADASTLNVISGLADGAAVVRDPSPGLKEGSRVTITH